MRFEIARELLRPPDRPSLADVAAQAGYYDQAHNLWSFGTYRGA